MVNRNSHVADLLKLSGKGERRILWGQLSRESPGDGVDYGEDRFVRF